MKQITIAITIALISTIGFAGSFMCAAKTAEIIWQLDQTGMGEKCMSNYDCDMGYQCQGGGPGTYGICMPK